MGIFFYLTVFRSELYNNNVIRMESRENPLFGRKIFFVSPSFVTEKFLFENLRKNEYEVYIINDYRKAKSVLMAYPDSMCFINIDSELSYSEWFNYMKSFADSESLKGIYLGVMTESAGWEDKDKFMMNIRLPGGFNQVEKTEKFLKNFIAILDLNGAKGRRKYLRLDTRSNADVSGYMTFQGKLYAINIKDISSAGFAITYKQDIMFLFQKNTHIRNLCISAGRKSMVCSCIVFNTLPNADGTAMSVLMLTNENPEATKSYIREYIFAKLDRDMDALISEVNKDSASYSSSDEYSKIIAVRNREIYELEPLGELSEDGDDAVNGNLAREFDEDVL